MSKEESNYVILDKKIYQCTELSCNERFILLEVNRLNHFGQCYANTRYFANLIGRSRARTSTLINELVKKGCLRMDFVYHNGSARRLMEVVMAFFEGANLPTGVGKRTLTVEKPTEGVEKPTGGVEKPTHNYKNINKRTNSSELIQIENTKFLKVLFESDLLHLKQTYGTSIPEWDTFLRYVENSLINKNIPIARANVLAFIENMAMSFSHKNNFRPQEDWKQKRTPLPIYRG